MLLILLFQKRILVSSLEYEDDICNILKVLFYFRSKLVSLDLTLHGIKQYQHAERSLEGLVAFFQKRQQLISTLLSVSEDYPE